MNDLVVKKRRIAKAAPFILSHVLFERYSTAGIASILVLFLNLKIGYDQDTSTAVYHAYVFFAYFLSIVGSIIADSWWGQFKTLVWMSIVFASGCFVITLGTIDVLKLPIVPLTISGLIIITVGSGCIKPCINTFGGDQYEYNEIKSMTLFFSLSYFVFNFGSIVSRFVNPIFREDVKCFGGDDCYPLAFGIPGVMVLFAALGLLAGKRFSVCKKSSGNMLVKVCGCIWHAICLKFSSPTATKTHWLDRSEEKYGKKMVMETKMILNVLVLFLPLQLFWALFDQQGSRWIFQATRMNGNVGWFTIKPDQFTVINPFMALILIPCFEYFLYPMLKMIGVKSPLQKATVGGILAGISFILSAIVETQLENELHMLWLLPQYFVMTLGEILISIPLMHFSYTEAPESMKSVLQAFRFLTIAGGNLIDVIVAGSKLVDSQVYEFLLFAGLMFIDMLIFGILAKRYKYVDQEELKKLND